MVVAWVLFPLVLLAVCIGCGLAVERASGWVLPGAVLPSVGLALVIVAATLTTSSGATASWTTWVVLALAIGGYATSWSRLRALRPEPMALAVGLGVFAVCAAPVVLTGNASFLGYFVDNDSAFHFALLDQVMHHGPDTSVVHPYSAYLAILQEYLGTSYPTGADVGLGAVRPLVGQDVAWVFQPYLAVILALGAAALYELLRDAVRSVWLRGVCAVVAAQAGLVYAFYLEGSIKEVASTWVITVTVVLVLRTLARPTLRRTLALLVVAVAGLDVLDLAIVPWLGVPLAAYAVLALWRSRLRLSRIARRRALIETAAAVVVAGILAEPILRRASTFFSTATSVLGRAGTANTATQFGNLPMPLPRWELFGIWPVGDFRYDVVAHEHVGYALIGVAVISAGLGALWTLRRRAWGPLLQIVATTVAAVYLLSRSSPYAASKVMMIFSLTVVLAAMLGSVALVDSGRRLEGWLLAAILAGGVLWTNALAYSNATVAPRGRFAELAAIGQRFHGQGRAFYNQADEYAIHFLRSEAPDDPATGAPLLRPGLPPRTPEQGRLPWDPDDLAQSYVQSFRLLVLGRSPRTSRPPANYRLAYQGRYYDVWKRTTSPTVLTHVPLGAGLYPDAVPSCRVVLRTAAQAAREHARLAYVARGPVPALVPTRVPYPPNWGVVTGDPYELIPRSEPGAVGGPIDVPRAGTYQLWLESSLSQRFRILIDGRRVASVSYELGPQGQFVHLGAVTLSAGTHRAEIVRPPVNGLPGQDATGMYLGPLMLTGGGDAPSVAQLAPSQAHALCGRSLDWLEIVR